jgi:hypothetical protein
MGSSPSTREDSETADAPTRQLVSAAVGDRCTNCGVPLASDQRYCVNCGERRGKRRFSFAGVQPQTVTTTTSVRREPRAPRASSGSALLVGIGVLLLAMGVGVLIGRANQNNTPRAAASPPVQVVTVGGGGGSGAASTTPTTAAGTNTPSSSSKNTKAANVTKKIVVTKKVQAKANAAAAQVLGGGSNLPPPTVTQQGQSCSSGAGCQGGKFTGNFFGQ